MNTKNLLVFLWLALASPSAAWAQSAPLSVELTPGVTAKIVALKRVPGQDMVQLDYEVSNAGSAPVPADQFGLGSSAYGLRNITLMDFKAATAYTVGIANDCLCSSLPEEALAPGQTLKFWAWFAPPTANPGPYAVRFGQTMPILDVPLQ